MQGGTHNELDLADLTATVERSVQGLMSKLQQHERLNARIMHQAAARYMGEDDPSAEATEEEIAEYRKAHYGK